MNLRLVCFRGQLILVRKAAIFFWRYNYALQAIDQGTAIMKWISTSEQIADILTKRIKPNNQLFKLRSMILNCNNSKHGNY